MNYRAMFLGFVLATLTMIGASAESVECTAALLQAGALCLA